MKWFDRWFYKKAKWAWENKDLLEEDQPDVPITRSSVNKGSRLIAVDEDHSWGDGLRINVKKVIGGKVISFRTYDRKTDRSEDRHYIITDEQDFNSELGKMITMESMRQS